MNFKCLICSELFTPLTEISATKCGHLYHFHCLALWLKRSKTCPQCRTKVTFRNIFKIYDCIGENSDALDYDYSTWQNKVENLEYEIKIKNEEIEKCEDLKVENRKLRESLIESEESYAVFQKSYEMLTVQIEGMQNRNVKQEVSSPVEEIYDGLGDHSKEGLDPSPTFRKSLKRSKSTCTNTSAKWRKL